MQPFMYIICGDPRAGGVERKYDRFASNCHTIPLRFPLCSTQLELRNALAYTHTATFTSTEGKPL